ncbi:MAG: hypothetical protein MUE73_11125 [Planctomycetes bacterium]|jgi:hypothetical protein|nr:hypothetical protein [Planctomycetota bacterium]
MMIYRYHIESFARADEKRTADRLRELGLESWDLITVLPGSRTDPADPKSFTFIFRRDASTDINL